MHKASKRRSMNGRHTTDLQLRLGNGASAPFFRDFYALSWRNRANYWHKTAEITPSLKDSVELPGGDGVTQALTQT